MKDLDTLIKERKISEEEVRRLNNPNSRRNFIKKAGQGVLYSALAACGLGNIVSCKSPAGPEPINDEYTVTVNCYDMTSLQGDNFVDNLKVNDAQVIKGGTLMPIGQYTFQHKGHSISLNYNGSVHDTVLCVRKPGSSDNLTQTQNGNPAQINLQYLGQGNNITLELYKIPDWVNIDWVKEALRRGSAIYNKDITVWLDNEGYTPEQFQQDLPTIKQKVNNALTQINPCTTGITATLDENATSGELEVRLSPYYINPTHAESGSGIMTQSEIQIMTLSDLREYLEELYQAMGVRDDVGGRLSDEISNDTGTLNRFGKGLMRINYFLDPNTKL